jgi:hypothetical protein
MAHHLALDGMLDLHNCMAHHLALDGMLDFGKQGFAWKRFRNWKTVARRDLPPAFNLKGSPVKESLFCWRWEQMSANALKNQTQTKPLKILKLNNPNLTPHCSHIQHPLFPLGVSSHSGVTQQPQLGTKVAPAGGHETEYASVL